MGKIRRMIGTLALGAALAAAAGGCASRLPIVSQETEDGGYTDGQIMVVVATERNRYREVYTDQIWQAAADDEGTTFHDCLLREIQDFLCQLRTMNLLAEEKEIALTGQEKDQAKNLAALYYESLSREDLDYMGVSQEEVEQLYEEYYRANKLVDQLTSGVDLEISDSEARVMEVEELVFSDQEKAQEAYRQVGAEGADFDAEAKALLENGAVPVLVGRGERSAAYEAAVFSLETGQISQVFEDGGSWYIVRCVNDYDEEATLERKQKLALQRKNQAFRQIYDSFAAEHPVQMGGELWEEISLTDGEGCTSDTFFSLYQQQLGESGV